jgi:hypothetical protein
MEDPEAKNKALVTTLITTLSQASGVDVDAVLRSLKAYEVSA